MDINAANNQRLFENLDLRFRGGLDAGMVMLSSIAPLFTEVPSSGAFNLYPFVEALGTWRKWLGERQFRALKSTQFSVTNETFEFSQSIQREQLNDEQFGLYPQQFNKAGEKWPRVLRNLVVDVLLNNPDAYDAAPLLGTTRKYGENLIDNLTTDAFSAAAFDAGLQKMSSWKMANGEQIEEMPTYIVHGPALHTAVFGVIEAERTASAGASVDNPNRGRVQSLEVPRITGNQWFLIRTDAVVAPVILQRREEPTLFMDDEATARKNRRVDFWADGRAAAAPTFPHLVYGRTAA